MKILILGIGNPICCDDAAGIAAVRQLKQRVMNDDIDIEETTSAGMNLLDAITGYDKVVIIDSIQTENGKAGEIYRFTPDEIDEKRPARFSHNGGILLMLSWGKEMKIKLPVDIVFYAIEIEKGDEFGEEFTPQVKAAIPRLISEVEKEVNKF